MSPLVPYQFWESLYPDLPPFQGNEWVEQVLVAQASQPNPSSITGVKINHDLMPQISELIPDESFAYLDQGLFRDTNIVEQGFPPTEDFRPAARILHFKDVNFIYDRTGFVIFDQAGVSPYSRSVPRLATLRAPVTVSFDTGYVAVDRYNQSNICHQIVDHLGYAIIFQDFAGASADQIYFELDRIDYVSDIRKNVLGLSLNIEPDEVYHFKNLYMLSDSFFGPWHPARFCDSRILDRLRQVKLGPVPSGSVLPKKIFIGRSDAPKRRILNEDSLSATLEKYGFENIVTGNLTPSQQFSYFQSADFIVAAHGAALTSLLFCRPGTRIFEMHNPERGTSAFCSLSKSLGLQYSAFFGDSVSGSADFNWSVDISKLLSSLAEEGYLN